jgi:hypothetical protein
MAEAQLHGTLVFDGGFPCDCCFEYGDTIAYGIYTAWQYGLVTGDTFQQMIYGLRYGTTYYYRAVARNIAGVAVAAGTTLTTPSKIPEIVTVAATVIDDHTAQLNYYLYNDMGDPCVVWFEYGATKAYGSESGKVPSQVSGGAGGIDITGLGAGKPFHFRAAAQNKYGIGYGEDMVFTTLSNLSPYSGLSMELMLLLEEA